MSPPAALSSATTRSPSSSPDHERDRERGSASIWVLACAALIVFMGSIVTLHIVATLARHKAESAADLAALAAAGQIGIGEAICAPAAVVATANQARVIRCATTLSADGLSGQVDVTVSLAVRFPVLGPVNATASARAARERAPP